MPEDMPDRYPLITEAAASETKPGTTLTKTYRLREYYDYLQVYPDMTYMKGLDSPVLVPETGEAAGGLIERLTGFFRIPCPDETVTVTVTKDAQGRVTEWRQTHNGYTANSESAWNGTGAMGLWVGEDYYFTCAWRTAENYGLYRLPFRQGKTAGALTADWDGLETVFQLPEGCDVSDLFLTEDGADILLITTEQEEAFVYVLDAKSMQLRSRLDAGPLGWGSALLRGSRDYRDHSLLFIDDKGLVHLFYRGADGWEERVNMSGKPSPVFSGELHLKNRIGRCVEPSGWSGSENIAWDYDGDRLVIACPRLELKNPADYESFPGSSWLREIPTDFQIFVWQNGEYVYSGKYISSLTTGDEAVHMKAVKLSAELKP